MHGSSSHVDGQLFSSQDDVQSSSYQFSSSQMDHQDTQLSHVDNSNSQLTQASSPASSVVGSVSTASSSQPSGKSRPKCYMTKSRIKAKSVTDKNKRQQQLHDSVILALCRSSFYEKFKKKTFCDNITF